MSNLSLAMRNFNERVKVMNQTGSRQLVLSAEEARNLHSDMFNLLATLANSAAIPEKETQEQLNFDGGSFK